MGGRGGKHAGQKRTYRAIAETYAFLPREAVTKFLMSCADCQKRMHFSIDNVEQKLLGQSSPIKHSKTEAHDQGQTKYRRSLKRLKAGFEPPSADQQTSDDYDKSNIANYFAHKKFKVELDHVTTNYNSKRTWIQSGSGLTSSSQEVDHPGLAELRPSCSDDRSSHSNVPLDLSTSKQNITQPKKEAPTCPFHHDFGGGLTENPVPLIGDDVPMEQQLSERSLEIVAHNTPGKQLLPFFSSRYLSSPFISNFFFQNFCASTYKSSFSAVGTNKFNLIPEFLSNDNFHRNMFRTYHFEESSHLQISPRDVSGLSFPKLSNLRQILSLPQLIAGYRDSASFLRRSADELECFLQRTV